MATCKDCVHVDVCCSYLSTVYNKCKLATPDFKLLKNIQCDECQHFKDRSRFVELPCKVGDTIFCIIHILGETEIVSSKVQRILFTEDDCRLIVQDNNYIGLSVNDVGKTIFLTREEAEQALKERDTK